MIGGILLILGGIVLMVLSGYGIWYIVSLMLKGILTSNWLMVIGGGVLFYLLVGFLVVVFIVGGAIALAGVDEL